MARNLENSRANPESVDADEAYLRAQARYEDLTQDLKVQTVVLDQLVTQDLKVQRVHKVQ